MASKPHPIPFVPLALVNSIGYAATTAVPFWISDLGPHFGLPVWVGGIVAILQLLSAATCNLLTPLVFSRTPMARVGVGGAAAAVFGGALALLPNPLGFFVGAVVSGGGLGVLLNCTNRLVAQSHSAQKGYATFQLVEIFVAVSLYSAFPLVGQRFGPSGVLFCLSILGLLGAGLIGWLAPWNVPSDISPTGAALASAARGRKAGLFILAAIVVLFSGQSAVYSYMVPVGRLIHVNPASVGRLMSLGSAFGLVGALVARLIGERFGDRAPVIAGALLLGLDLAVVTTTRDLMVFSVAACLIGLLTAFLAPYLFTLLARFDRSGKMASVGPSALLTGLAIGPAIATLVAINFAIPRIGPAALGIVLLSTGLIFTGVHISRPTDEYGA